MINESFENYIFKFDQINGHIRGADEQVIESFSLQSRYYQT